MIVAARPNVLVLNCLATSFVLNVGREILSREKHQGCSLLLVIVSCNGIKPSFLTAMRGPFAPKICVSSSRRLNAFARTVMP